MNRIILAIACVIALSSSLHASIKVAPIFGDHMVLQRDMEVPIWGTADKGEMVVVEYAGQKKETKAGDDGKWMIKLDKMKASAEGKVLKASSSKNPDSSIQFSNVVVGEVWIGSGQSNMDWHFILCLRGNRDPVLKKWSEESVPGLRMFDRGGWMAADPKIARNYSALGFAFAYSLHKELKVPVGIMIGAVGGQPSGRFLTLEMGMASSNELLKSLAEENAELDRAKVKKDREELPAKLAEWDKRKKEAKEAGTEFNEPRPQNPPMLMGDLYEERVERFVPYAIRGVLWDQGESGTGLRLGRDKVRQDWLMQALITGWRKEWGQAFPFLHIQKRSGGGCAYDPENPINKGAYPWKEAPKGRRGGKQSIREAAHHIMISQRVKNTYMVQSSDLAYGQHPPCKSGYGARAARVALGEVYGKDVESSGPVYKSHTVEGNEIHVTFDHVGKGLTFVHSNKIQGFEVQKDHHWYWTTDARIEGDKVIVSSPEVEKPIGVRYGWTIHRFEYANLFNKDGLPTVRFTTEKE